MIAITRLFDTNRDRVPVYPCIRVSDQSTFGSLNAQAEACQSLVGQSCFTMSLSSSGSIDRITSSMWSDWTLVQISWGSEVLCRLFARRSRSLAATLASIRTKPINEKRQVTSLQCKRHDLKNVIAVGTAIAGRPPHRSVREELPHTAPPLSDDGRDESIATCRACTLAHCIVRLGVRCNSKAYTTTLR